MYTHKHPLHASVQSATFRLLLVHLKRKERSKEERLLFTLTLLHSYSSAVVHLESAELLL